MEYNRANQFTGKILVVDDLLSVRTLLTKILTQAGNEVITAENGREAIAHCEKYHVDVVLLDLNMPEMGGIEVCETVRETLPDLQIIMLTGVTDNGVCQRTITKGANDFISKPIDAGEVLIRVKNAIQISRMRDDLTDHIRKGDQMCDTVNQLDDRLKRISSTDGSARAQQELDEYLTCFVNEDGLDEALIELLDH